MGSESKCRSLMLLQATLKPMSKAPPPALKDYFRRKLLEKYLSVLKLLTMEDSVLTLVFSLLSLQIPCFVSGVSLTPLLKDRTSCFPNWCWTHYVAKGDFEVLVLPTLPPECWDHRCVPPCQAYAVLWVWPRTLSFMASAGQSLWWTILSRKFDHGIHEILLIRDWKESNLVLKI